MAIKTNTGGTLITGDDIPRFRLVTILSGLKIETRTGMKVSRGRSCSLLAKETLRANGIKPKQKRVDLLPQFALWLLMAGIVEQDSPTMRDIDLVPAL